jgi:hypothetical protein
MLNRRPLLLAILGLFVLLEASLGRELAHTGFDWRPLWGAPVVKATMLDFSFTVLWCGLFLLDEARRQNRNGWAWIPLLLILPTAALFLFSLTAPRERGGRDQQD